MKRCQPPPKNKNIYYNIIIQSCFGLSISLKLPCKFLGGGQKVNKLWIKILIKLMIINKCFKIKHLFNFGKCLLVS